MTTAQPNTTQSPLDASISGGTVNLGSGQSYPFTTAITGYHGEQLFFKALSDGQTLTISIDDIGPSNIFNPGRGAHAVTVTVSYKSQQPATWVSACNYDGTPLSFALAFSADLLTATINIGEQVPDPNAFANLGYVVVADPANPSQLLMSWVVPSMRIDDYTALLHSSIVEPAQVPQSAGGILGPLGIALTP